MRTRTGKIARLPESIRGQLNQRLSNAHSGRKIMAWLNELPEVKQILAEQFHGRPISEHNISEWRTGGYQDWRREMETRNRILRATEKCHDPDSASQIQARTSTLLAHELMDAVKELRQIQDGDAHWTRLRRLCREFERLRKGHTLDIVLRLESEKAQARQTGQQRKTSFLGASRS